MIIPDTFIEEKEHVQTSPKNYVRTYGFLLYPRLLNVGFLNEFFSIGTVNISVYVENIPDRIVCKKLLEEIAALHSNIHLAEKRGEIPNFSMVETVNDLQILLRNIQTNQDRAFYVQVIVSIYARSKEELENKCEEFEDICARKNIRPLSLMLEQKKGYLTSLPYMNIRYTELLRNMTIGGVACLVPLGNTALCHPKGVYLGYNMLTNSPIFYDVFIGPPTLVNPHMIILGIPGAGKSVTLKLLALRNCAMGRYVIILDPEGENKDLVEYVGGQYITIRPGVKTGINPFELEVEVGDDGRRYVDIQGKVSEIRELISTFIGKFRPTKPLEGAEISVLEEAVRELYSERGITSDPDSLYVSGTVTEDGVYRVGKMKKEMPTLSDLREKLAENQYTQELAELMKIITGDGSMALFDCKTSIDLRKRIIGFNFKHITDEFLKFFSIINVMSWIWAKFSDWKLKTFEKIVEVDEGWLFTKYEHSSKYLEEIIRRGRKYKISLMIASQQIEEFLNSQEGVAIINMCATKFLMKQNADSARRLAEYFNLSPRCAQLMPLFTPGQAFLLSESDITMIKVVPFKFEEQYVTIQYNVPVGV